MKEFWQEQAIKYKSDVKAVNYDLLEDQLEFQQLERLVANHKRVGDIGCGNGRATLFLAQKFPDKTFVGMDFIPEMIEAAEAEKRKLGLTNVEFLVANLAERGIKGRHPYEFDFVFTKRLLINLKGAQKEAGVDNIFSMLRNGGTYALIECFEEPLARVNEIRTFLQLPRIEVKFFNEYLNESFLSYVENYGDCVETIDFESFYYFISRVFNAKLSEGSVPDYFAPINLLAVKLMENGYAPVMKGFAPEKIYVFTKRGT